MQELAKSISELVNSLNGGAKGLAEAMQRVAPDAWRIAVRQVVIDAVTGWIAWTAFALLIVVVSLKFAANQRANEAEILEEQKKVEREQRVQYMCHCEGAAEGWQTAKWIARCLAVVVVLVTTASYLPTLVNPQYEAASKLSARFLGKSAGSGASFCGP